MRELAKSFNSFSWALSVFSAQQLLNLVQRPVPGPGDASTTGLGSVAQAAEGQLGGTLRQTFESGDRLQRRAVDLAFDLLNPATALDPSRWAGLSSEAVRWTTSAFSSLIPGGSGSGGSGSGCSGSQPCGWGPMPPAK